MFVLDELSFDRFHTKADRLYASIRFLLKQWLDFLNAESSGLMGPTMVDEFLPEVEKIVRYQTWFNQCRIKLQRP